MELNNNDIEHANQFSFMQTLSMFVGFVIFISGFFLVAYSLVAWLLVVTIELSIAYCLFGTFCSYIGRKLMRQGRTQKPLVDIS